MYKAYNQNRQLISSGNSRRECISNGKLSKLTDPFIINSANTITVVCADQHNNRIVVNIFTNLDIPLITVLYKSNYYSHEDMQIKNTCINLKRSIENSTDDYFENYKKVTEFAQTLIEFDSIYC